MYVFSLTKQEILSELLDLFLQEPCPELEEKMRFKLPNIASEVICCDVPQVKVASDAFENVNTMF